MPDKSTLKDGDLFDVVIGEGEGAYIYTFQKAKNRAKLINQRYEGLRIIQSNSFTTVD